MDLHKKYAALQTELAAYKKLAVAYSGGVDSTFLLAAARTVCEDVLAVTAYTQAIPQYEMSEAAAYAQEHKIAHIVLQLNAFAEPEFGRNAPERCYHCKKALFTAMLQAVKEKGFATLAEGSNADDVLDYRPGLAAVAELGVRSPLKAAGLTKADIRALSQELGLPTWSKPSYACLASRVPYGTAITPAMLRSIDAAEQVLHQAGFLQARVRWHGEVARIEVPPAQLEEIMRPAVRTQIEQGIKAAGFSYVAVDIAGYRTGSLNETLPPEVLKRARA